MRGSVSTEAAASVGRAVPAGVDLAVSGVTKSFNGTPVLHGAELRAGAGSLVALLGPSGCGKTTLLRCIAGLERPNSGEIRAGERVLCSGRTWVAAERRRIGMVFQQPALFPHMSVARNVGYGLSRAQRRGGRIDEVLELVGLAGFGERMPGTLSGGQQQRVALARALAPSPTAILLDEPFSSLDTPLRAGLRAEVRDLLRRVGTTGIFVTHDQEEAFAVGDEVAVMLDGAIAQQGSPTAIYELPATRAVARFIGDANLVPGVGRGETAETALGAIPLVDALHGPVDVVVRPERIAAGAGADARVERVEYYGHDAVHELRLIDGTPVRARVLGPPVAGVGERLVLAYDGPPTVAFAAAGAEHGAAADA